MSLVIISGALGDIGAAAAIEFAKAGYDVALGDIRAAGEANDLIEKINSHGQKAYYHQADISDNAAVCAWVQKVEKEIACPDAAVINAAIVGSISFADLEPAYWDKELSVNLNGAFYLSHEVAKRMKHNKIKGRIVFVGSWAAERVHPHIPTYCVAKAGVRMLCKCMAGDYAKHGIRVNEIAPGFVNAGLSAQSWDDNPEARERAIENVPLKELVEAEEVGEQIVYLCSKQSKHMTGSTLLMEGGLSLRGFWE